MGYFRLMATFAYARNKHTEICHLCCEQSKENTHRTSDSQSFCMGEKLSFEKDSGSMNKCHSAWDDTATLIAEWRRKKGFFYKASFDAIETLNL